MNKLKRWIREYFFPDALNKLDTEYLLQALNDARVREVWLRECIAQLMLLNLEVDRRVLGGETHNIVDLCARRKAFQDILELILFARRHIRQDASPNPRVFGVDLDRVTG